MRVLLLLSNSGPGKPPQAVFPIGLAYIAASLREDHELFSLDLNASEDPERELHEVLGKFDPDVVAVSFRNIDAVQSYINCSYYPSFVSAIRNIRKMAPSCKLVVGGAGFSIFSKEIMQRNPEIDFGVQSEGEHAFSELLRNLDHPEKVKGILLRKNGKIVFTEAEEEADFDLLPSPYRDVFDLDKYRGVPSSIGVQSKRGCRFGCIYCLHSFFMGSNYRLRRPAKVVDEIENLVTKYGINNFYFVDSVFNAPLDHAREICREIIRRKLDVSWEACFRPDLINAKFMEEATVAGCRLFDFSPDGASNDAMQVLGKNLKVEDVEKTIDLIRRVGNAQVAYEFMYDLPCNNTEQVLGLARLFPKIMLRCREKLRSVSLTRMRVYPHTRLYDIALRQGQIRPDTDLLYPVYYESGASKLLTDVLPHAMRVSAFLFQNFNGTDQ